MPPVGAAVAAALPYIIGGAVVAGTAATIVQGNNAAKSAKSAAADQASKQNALEKQAADRAANQESEANAINIRDAAKRRQANLAVGAGGRQDTILTGPQGVPDEYSGGKKTLLGT